MKKLITLLAQNNNNKSIQNNTATWITDEKIFST